MKSIVDFVADYFIPSHCFYCNRAVSHGGVICSDCYKVIEKTDYKVCDKCGRHISNCDCKKFVYHFSGITAPFKNEGIAKAGLYGVKFASDEACVRFYAEHMAERLKEREIDLNFDFITFVPMSLTKKIKRGYNQAELLADSLAKSLKLKVRRNLLYRSIFSKTQHKNENIDQRFRNAYQSYKRTGKKIYGRVLLVDDIKTSGASLEACSKELMYMGAEEVFCVTALISDKTVEKSKKI